MKIKKYKQIIDDVKNQVYYPVYTLYGEEPYYIDLIANFIEDNILTDSEKEFNLSVLYGRDSNVPDLISVLKRFPMMANYQVVILREAQYLDKIEDLESYFEHPLKSTIFVICYKYKKIDGRTKFAKAIDKYTVSFESSKLYENKIPDWICEYLKDKNLNITPTACLLLAEHLGNNIGTIANELDKLALNIKAGESITETHIEQNIGISKEFTVFELQKALSLRNKFKAFRIVHYFAANIKDNPIPKVAPMLVDYFAKVMITKTLIKSKADNKDIASAIGTNIFYINDYKLAAKNFTDIQLRKCFSILREYDLKSKGVGNTEIHANDGELMKEMIYKILIA